MKFQLMFVFILIFVSSCFASNILYLSPLPSHSHHFWNSAIANELAKRGHNITIISPDAEASPPAGVNYILIEDLYVYSAEYVKAILSASEMANPFYEAFAMLQSYDIMCSGAVESNGFRTLLNYPDNFKFDLVVHDFTVGSCLLPFLHKFNYPPMLAVTAFGYPSFTNDLIGGHHYYSYVPHMFLPFDDEMSFVQRFLNFLIHVEEYFLFKYYLTPRLDAIVSKHFGSVPSVGELEQRAALAFVNIDPVMESFPLPQNVIPVAGVHIKEPRPLPKDLKTFIDSSAKGAVVFSLGSNFRSDFMPVEKQRFFIKIFSELSDYHFLWKFESDIAADDLPKNVMIQKWLPVSDMLADPKVKAIYFHGGMLTTHEAIWRAVPMIIMPFALDQRKNLQKTKQMGIAEGVDYLSLNHNETRGTILKVLEDPSYALNARKWAARFRDQKEKPIDRAVWWTEWLIRNPDCEYLKSPVLRLGFIIGNSFDIVAFIAISLVLFLIISVKLVSFCVGKCFKTNSNHIHKKTE